MIDRIQYLASTIATRVGNKTVQPLDILEACAFEAPTWFDARQIPAPDRVKTIKGSWMDARQTQMSPEAVEVFDLAKLVAKARKKDFTTISDVVYALVKLGPGDVYTFWGTAGFDRGACGPKLREEEPLVEAEKTIQSLFRQAARCIEAAQPLTQDDDLWCQLQDLKAVASTFADRLEPVEKEITIKEYRTYTVTAVDEAAAMRQVEAGKSPDSIRYEVQRKE